MQRSQFVTNNYPHLSAESENIIQLKTGIFSRKVLAGCVCSDDISQAINDENGYCELHPIFSQWVISLNLVLAGLRLGLKNRQVGEKWVSDVYSCLCKLDFANHPYLVNP
jgi:hypothetical protein